MESIDEFAPHTSVYEILSHVYDMIAGGELKTFEQLEDYVRGIPGGKNKSRLLEKAFALQKKLYWGFFSSLNSDDYSGLWNAIVIQDDEYTFAGDLKRFMSIPDIYLGLLDIHGYTRYCQDKRRNMSMIDLLDRMIQEDVAAISRESGVLSRRAQGDEIILIGASAMDVMRCVLHIMDYFKTQGRSFCNTVISRKLPGTVLPRFQISAGLAGGQKFTPLVITRDGDISGDIVNTAARLQAKANRLSPHSNRILLTSHVYQKLKKSLPGISGPGNRCFRSIDFFNIGLVEFKGVSLTVFDVLFLPREKARLEIQKEITTLSAALRKNMWTSNIFIISLHLAKKVLTRYLDDENRKERKSRAMINNYHFMLEQIKAAGKLFGLRHYETAITVFSLLVDGMKDIQNIDSVTIGYLLLVRDNYTTINETFIEYLDNELEIQINDLFAPEEKSNFLMLKKYHSAYDSYLKNTRQRVNNRQKIWKRLIDDMSDSLNTVLQSIK